MVMASVMLLDPVLGVELEYDEEVAPLIQAIHDFGGFIIEAKKIQSARRGCLWSLEFSKLDAMQRLLRAISATEPDALPHINVGACLVESSERYTSVVISLIIAPRVLAEATRAARRLRKIRRPQLKLVGG
jgi:hypothetical protein